MYYSVSMAARLTGNDYEGF